METNQTSNSKKWIKLLFSIVLIIDAIKVLMLYMFLCAIVYDHDKVIKYMSGKDVDPRKGKSGEVIGSQLLFLFCCVFISGFLYIGIRGYVKQERSSVAYYMICNVVSISVILLGGRKLEIRTEFDVWHIVELIRSSITAVISFLYARQLLHVNSDKPNRHGNRNSMP